MEFKELIDDIEKICTTCETCEPSCAANTFKKCITSEMEIEAALQQLVGVPRA